jgi:hypothetical protein
MENSPMTRSIARTVRLAALIAAVLPLASGCDQAPAAADWNCKLCAPSGILSCADPGTNACPDTKPGDALPICGVVPGYSVSNEDCGGRRINGLRCATHCAWVLGPDASAEIFDAGTITYPPGCTLPVQGEPGVCVVNCSDCQ